MRELKRRSVCSAIRADSKESGAIWWENAAVCGEAFGYSMEARQAAAAGWKLYPDSSGVAVEAVLAMSGDAARAEPMAADIHKLHPHDTQIQSLWLPSIRAQHCVVDVCDTRPMQFSTRLERHSCIPMCMPSSAGIPHAVFEDGKHWRPICHFLKC